MKILAVVTVYGDPYTSPKGVTYHKCFVADESPHAERCMTELALDCGSKHPSELGLVPGSQVEVVIRQIRGVQQGIPVITGPFKVISTPTKAPAGQSGKAA